VNNAKKVKIDSAETNELKKAIAQPKTSQEKIKALWEDDKGFNKTKAAELVGISRQQVINIVKKLEGNEDCNVEKPTRKSEIY
jgi:hypothetical protein